MTVRLTRLSWMPGRTPPAAHPRHPTTEYECIGGNGRVVQLHTEAQCRGAPACRCAPSIPGRGAAMRNPMRSCGGVVACLLFASMLSLAPVLPARAAINANNLGAKYDAS